MGKFNEKERPYMDRLLLGLRDRLVHLGVEVHHLSDQNDRPCLEVFDGHLRARRVYAHLAFMWFFWGSLNDERTSCHDLDGAAEVIAAAAQAGWPAEEQGHLGPDLQKILDAYQS
ncbi:hypothetical protein Ssi03_75710 [Sphaerisporangium siamense]|uniref:Uncharacterized protein n=1 Tax=Sphaerisporangium siamense TaxID=795645 RepID=A0A7W7D5H8_9ACTN|nr:hypothetical protein [Sphaerisporangium siamense]MBB4700652.1 hypothetical protein [Sphaerisporangium siamense]GII89581.1 hypothetical protein Ssi03_75710 [Sphaerisporangium siamense]